MWCNGIGSEGENVLGLYQEVLRNWRLGSARFLLSDFLVWTETIETTHLWNARSATGFMEGPAQ